MLNVLRSAAAKLTRDKDLPPWLVARKAWRYSSELLSAGLHLRGVDRVGQGVRTCGKPRIDNLGYMEIGAGTLLRSVNVPVELASGAHGRLVIGVEVRLNYGVSIGAMQNISLGDRVRVGPYVMIIDTEFHDAYDRTRMATPRPVVVEDDVFIGAKANIMPGVRIGRGSIVATAALVNKDVEPFTVVGGVPARPLRALDPDKFVVAQA